MHLAHVSGEGGRSGVLARALLASEVAIFLVLQQNVRILKLLVAVVAERLQGSYASTFASHD